ncbi:MAG: hypothetical protein EZS28_027597 [Streblomastix strix]|uniref:Uncharacterized protein n=1 Tax=Streblomastix strix TaxID=222440 RepID=A0A5J4V2M6_9EUKA|nr:MAG: hypothetical protein EZS28_027597 [Streblomastix strix]
MCFIVLLAVSATIGEALSPNSVSLAVPDNYLCANSILEVKEHTPYFVAGYIPPQSWQICKKECNIEIANNQTTKRKISCNFEWMSISINFDERSIEKLTEISYILFKK